MDENDVLQDEGEAYARRLIQAGVPTTSVRYNGIVHVARCSLPSGPRRLRRPRSTRPSIPSARRSAPTEVPPWEVRPTSLMEGSRS
ncbi:alpha/beta hydrolase fold domain-containing protein [Streptomyces sp. 900105755]